MELRGGAEGGGLSRVFQSKCKNANVPATCKVYLRGRSAQTIVCAATPREKMQTEVRISPCHSILMLGKPNLAVTLYRQEPDRVATTVPMPFAFFPKKREREEGRKRERERKGERERERIRERVREGRGRKGGRGRRGGGEREREREREMDLLNCMCFHNETEVEDHTLSPCHSILTPGKPIPELTL